MYTLGLLFQELFTGKAPLERRPIHDQIKQAAAGHSRPVVGLEPHITTLIGRLKSLHPSDRPTAQETADRLKWIREIPLRRLRRWLIAAAILLSFGTVTKYTVDLRRERSAAIEARNEAVQTRDQAEDLITFMLEDLSHELRPAGKLEVLGKVASEALHYYEQVPSAATGEAAFHRGRAFHNVGEVLENQGDLDPALKAATTAKEIHQQLVTQNPQQTTWQIGLAEDCFLLSQILRQLGEQASAEHAAREALAITSALVDREPESVAAWETHAEAYYSLGIVHLFVDNEQAEQAFWQSIALFGQLATDHPEELHYKYRLAVLYGQGLGQIFRERGLLEKSFEMVQKAFQYHEELIQIDPSNSRWQHGFAWENRRMGEHFLHQGRTEEALEAYRRAQSITERILSFEPSQVDWRLGLGVDHESIGDIFETQGDLETALASYRQAEEIFQQMVDAQPTNNDHVFWLAMEHLNIANVLTKLGRTREAESAWQQAAKLTHVSAADFPKTDNHKLEVRALALLHTRQVDEAKPVVEYLKESGWFEANPDPELVELLRRFSRLW